METLAGGQSAGKEGGDNGLQPTSALLVLDFGTGDAEMNRVSMVLVDPSREGKAERESMDVRQGNKTRVLGRVLEDRSLKIGVTPGIGSIGTDDC